MKNAQAHETRAVKTRFPVKSQSATSRVNSIGPRATPTTFSQFIRFVGTSSHHHGRASDPAAGRTAWAAVAARLVELRAFALAPPAGASARLPRYRQAPALNVGGTGKPQAASRAGMGRHLRRLTSSKKSGATQGRQRIDQPERAPRSQTRPLPLAIVSNNPTNGGAAPSCLDPVPPLFGC